MRFETWNVRSLRRAGLLTLRGHWCDIVLNVCAPTVDESDNIEDSFCKEIEHVFNQFLWYHMEILLGFFNAEVGREDIFKPMIRNESLHEIIMILG